MFLVGQTVGATLLLPFSFISSIVTSYNGVLAYSRIGNKEKTGIINNAFLAVMVSWMVVAISAFLFATSALLFSGEFDLRIPGILIGAIGGLIARQKIQGKPMRLFGISV